jgi:outer membrane protein assembly factor BamB
VFDVPSGRQRAVQAEIASVATDRRVLTTTSDGRVLVLKSDADHAWVDAYEKLGLRPLGSVMEKPGCGDRLLASGHRVAIVCLATGEIAVDDLHGNHAAIDGSLPNLVAVAVADDGTLYVATADQHLAAVAAGATKLASVPWPREWSGTVLPDGLAVAMGGAFAVVAERNDDGAWLRVLARNDGAQRWSVRLAGAPQGGVIAMWPFGYYTMAGTVRHVDLNSGLLETMTEVGEGAIPGAVVNG